MNKLRLEVALDQLDQVIGWVGRCGDNEDMADIGALLGQARTKLLGVIDTYKGSAEDREYRSTLTAGD
jgi:hypothetical protein